DQNSDKYQSAGVNPDRDFKAGVDGLAYLRDQTYAEEWFKGDQKDAITALLDKLRKLRQAQTRLALDALISGWVEFEFSADVRRVTGLAAADHQVKLPIRTNWPKDKPEMAEEFVAPGLGGVIYKKFYKTGGGPGSKLPDGLDTEGYNKKVENLGTTYNVRAIRQGHGKHPGYFKFYPDPA